MYAIKVTMPKAISVDVAQTMLKEVSRNRGFLFGYVDRSEVRCVYFEEYFGNRSLRPDEVFVDFAKPVESKVESQVESDSRYTKANGYGDFRDIPSQSFHEK